MTWCCVVAIIAGMSIPPIAMRVRLTEAEYNALRKVAIDRNESLASTIGHALRKTYPSITERQAK